jgi:hypothetical protein
MKRPLHLLLPGSCLVLFCCSLLTDLDESKLTEDSYERCRDHVDNDGDGLVDCDDPGCAAFSFCAELSAAACSDGVDNDGDALVDCADPDCQRLDLCQEKSDAACSDGVDNNHNGLVDCADFDCYSSPACCAQAVPFFTGDSFSFASSCTVRVCADFDPWCCKPPYET